MKKIIIETGEIRLNAVLNDSETARVIYDILPLEGTANVWGDEIYFSIPVHIEQAMDAKQEVNIGDLGYWPSGDAFCIFFGPTPVSVDDTPMAYSPVNVFGSVEGDAKLLKSVSNSDIIKVIREQ